MSLGNVLKDKLKKKLKDDVVFLMDDGNLGATDVKTWVSTGCSELDFVIKNGPGGGIPVGRLTEITGHEATGKSLLAMQIMANAQQKNGYCIYIDTEQGLNTDFAARVGLDVKYNFVHIPSTTVEDVFVIVDEICKQLHEDKKNKEKTYDFVMIVWDSIAATNCRIELESDNPDPTATVGLKPRFLSKNVPMMLKKARDLDIGFVFINQLRTRIGAMPGQDPWIAPGGKSIPYAASVRIRLSSIGKMKDKKDNSIYGIKTRAKVLKNRFGPPHRIAEFPIYFSYGIDDEESIVNALAAGDWVIKAPGGRKGTIHYFSDESKDVGLNLVDFKRKLRDHPESKAKAREYLAKALCKDVTDPREIKLEVVTDAELDKK